MSAPTPAKKLPPRPCSICHRDMAVETVRTSEGTVDLAICLWCDRRKCGNCGQPQGPANRRCNTCGHDVSLHAA